MNPEDPSKIDNSLIITYNYTNNSIYLNQIIHTLKNDSFVEIPFISNGPPNIILNEKQYSSKSLYITGSNNLIQGIQYDGELVIEHTPITNDSSKKLYTVFLLQSNKSNSVTPIDSLIVLNNNSNNNSKQIDIGNSLNTDSKQIYYIDNNGNQVIIFTTPIKINSKINTINSREKLFTFNPTNYNIIYTKYSKNNIAEPFSIKEGLTNTAYCQPIEMIDPKISEDANLVIPLIGKYTPNDATNNIIRIGINFMAFVLVLGFTYLLAPMIYKDYIVGLISSYGQQKMNRIRSIDMYSSIVLILACFTFILQGVKTNDANFTIIGFFIGLFFIISFFIIQSKKLDTDWFKELFKTTDGQITADYNKVNSFEDFGKFILENGKFFNKNIFLGLFIFAIILQMSYLIGIFTVNKIFDSLTSILFLFLFSVYITIAVKTVTEEKD
jgi:hypothetical protein